MSKKFVVVAFILSLGLFAGCTKNNPSETPAPSNEILIGEYGSLTGEQATFGISTHQGLMLAIDEVNKAGGVNGKKIKVISIDDQGIPEQAAVAVTKLITQNHVIALIGEVASSNSLAAAPIAQQYKIPMISPSSTNPKVTDQGDYIFRVCFIDPFQGTVMAKFAFNNLHLKNVAILKDVKSDYSVGLASYFKETFTKLGGKIAAEETYAGNDIDFKAQLTSIKTVKPDGIFVPGYYTEVGLIARQTRGLGIKVPLMGGDGWDSSKLYEIGKEAVVGNFFSDHYSTDSKDPKPREFIEAFKKVYGTVPDAMAALAYDAGAFLVDAIKKSKKLDSTEIRDALATTKGFEGVTGKISMDDHRNAIKSAVVVQVKGDHNVFVTTINP